MPTTPTYALPYPLPTDPADVPTDLQKLATATEAAIKASGWWSQPAPGYIRNTGDTIVQMMRSSAGAQAVGIGLPTDTSEHFRIAANGRFDWGTGSAAPDTFLQRVFARGLQTNAWWIWSVPSDSSAMAFSTQLDADPQVRFGARVNGQLMWGDGTNGSDISLYRVGAGVLRVSGQLWVDGPILGMAGAYVAANYGAATQVAIGNVVSGYAGVAFGSASDTTLYRVSAGNLKTGSTFAAAQLRSDTYGIFNDNGASPVVAVAYNPAVGASFCGIGFTYDTLLYRLSAGLLNTDTAFRVGTNLYLGGNSSSIIWGGASDVSLYRYAANFLATAGTLWAGWGTSPGQSSVAVVASGDGWPRVALNNNGYITFGPGNGGTDCNIYRITAGELRTDTNLDVGGTLWLCSNNAILAFGAAYDTTLSRVFANALAASGALFAHGGGGFAHDGTDYTVWLGYYANATIHFGSAHDVSLSRDGVGTLAVVGQALSVGTAGGGTFIYTGAMAGVQGGKMKTYANWGYGMNHDGNPGYGLEVNSSIAASSFAQWSDERLKTNVAPIEGAVAALAQIRAVSFDWAAGAPLREGVAREGRIGVVGQDVQAVYPEACGEITVTDDDTEPGTTLVTVDYGALVAPVIAAIGELDARLATLEAAAA